MVKDKTNSFTVWDSLVKRNLKIINKMKTGLSTDNKIRINKDKNEDVQT